MKLFQLILIAVLSVCLISCSATPKVCPPERLPLNLADPSPVTLNKVKFLVVTKENAAEVFAALEKKGLPVVFALTGNDYKALALNIDSIKNLLIEQQSIIFLYKEYYESGSDTK